jgi:predicted Holliday junction resolvase-like endonuclease
MEGIMTMLVIVVVLSVFLVATLVILALMRRTLNNLHLQIKAMVENARKREQNAVSTSRRVHVAKISEQLAPLLPGFPQYSLKDIQWVGGTIDIIVWDGLEEDCDVTVVFLDVKTGKATTTHRQRKIQEAIEQGRVKFEVVRLPSQPW